MKDYHKNYFIPATAEDIYLALTTPITLHLWTGEPAEMSTEPGSEFSLWDGSIVGRNLEFERNRKLVQEWYFGEQDQPSIVTLLLHESKKGTSVELTHTNIPDDEYDDFVDGWDHSYFSSLKEFYKE